MKKPRKKDSLFHSVFMFFLMISCKDTVKTVQFDLEVKTHLGDPVPGATVYFNQDLIGETDPKGLLKVDQSRDTERPIQVSVKKNSETHYFSDYSQMILVPTEPEDSEKIPISLKITLFFVPKSTHENELEKAPETLAQDSSPKAPASTGLTPDQTPPPPRHPPSPPELATPLEVAHKDLSEGYESEELPKLTKVPQERLSEFAPPMAELPHTAADAHGKERPKESPLLITVHLTHFQSPAQSRLKNKQNPNNQSINQAQISLYLKNEGQPSAQCTTNQRGRCVLQIFKKPEDPVMVVATKKGFQTAIHKVVVKNQSMARMTLAPGHSLDVFTYQKIYERLVPRSGIRVLANQKPIGQTNEYGFMTVHWPVQEKSFTQVSLSLNQDQTLYETDFTGSLDGPITKYFSPDSPPQPRIVLAEPVLYIPPDMLESKQLVEFHLRKELARILFKSQLFQEYPLSLFDKRLRDYHQSPLQVFRHGFESIGLGPLIDGILFIEARPKIPGNRDQRAPWILEAKIIDRFGKTISGAIDEVEGPQTAERVGTSALPPASPSWQPSMKRLGQKLAASFPFQGSVKKVDGEKIEVSFGHTSLPTTTASEGFPESTHDMSPFSFYGLQVGEKGDAQTFKNIGRGTGLLETSGHATVTTSWIVPRAAVQVGDIVFRGWSETPSSGVETPWHPITVVGNNQNSQVPLPKATLYGDGLWLGESSSQGLLNLGPYEGPKPTRVTLTRPGYLPRTLKDEEIDFIWRGKNQNPKKPFIASLQPALVMVSIDSKPQGAEVTINQQVLGRTPLDTFLPTPQETPDTPEMTIQIRAGSGYKTFERKASAQSGAIMWRGEDTVIMETDDLARGDRLVLEGHPQEAVAIFGTIPATHSDYLPAQIRAGDLLNNVLDDPEQAAIHYRNAINLPETRDLKIAAHFNLRLEWIASVLKGYEKSPPLKQPAFDHFGASPEKIMDLSDLLDQIDRLLVSLPETKFAAEEDRVRSGILGNYYKSLTQHYLALQNNQPLSRYQAAKTWRNFLKQTAQTTDPTIRQYQTKAQRLLQEISKTTVSGAPAETIQKL